MKKRTHIIAILILALAGLIGTKALLKPDFYTNHDGEHQLVRQYIFNRAIKAGHIPPRFDRQLQNNLGYPLFTFTYQLPFWIGEILLISGFTIPAAVKGVFIITFIASGLAMYLFAQDKWGKLAGFIAAFLYMWAPYRFLTIFVRASLGEHTALIFIPLLLWSFSKLSKSKIRISIGAISIAGLLLSHSMVAQMSSIPIVLYWLARLWQEKHKLALIKSSLTIAILGLGLSAFYLIPAVHYQKYVQGLNSTFYAEHFVTLKQLIYSKWGYGFSQVGTLNDAMSFQIGIAQLIVIGLSLVVIVTQAKKILHRTALALILAFGLAVFFMTDPSSSIWEQAVKWMVIDIPWRFLAITTFTASALAGFLVKQTKSTVLKAGLITLLITTALYTNRNHQRINEPRVFDDNWFTSYQGTSNSYDEYKPIHTNQDLLKQENLTSVEVVTGDAQIQINQDQPHILDLSVQVGDSAKLQLNTVYFPGWQLFVNDNLQDIQATLSQGVPTVILEQGSHHIKLIYQQTDLMKLANIISVASGVIVLALLITSKSKNRA